MRKFWDITKLLFRDSPVAVSLTPLLASIDRCIVPDVQVNHHLEINTEAQKAPLLPTPGPTSQRREQLDQFFELSFDMFCIAGFDGYFKRLNAAWERELGFTNLELRAQPLIEFVHPEDRESTIAAVQEIAADCNKISFENRYRCKDGSYKWLLWNAVPFPDQQLIYAAARDITRRREAECVVHRDHEALELRVRKATADLEKSNEALQRAEWKYRSIFENAVEGIFQTTPPGGYISVNPALARIYGYSSPEELMTAVQDIGCQIYVDPNRRTDFKLLMERHSVVMDFEYQVYRKDGRKIWLSENARTVRDADGSLQYYEGTVEDITERKQLESQLRQGQKMEAVGQLAGGIAHDFNNLLSVICGYAELLEVRLGEHDPLHKNAQEITKAGRRAASLTRQLLSFSRQQLLEPRVLFLNSVVADVEKMLGRLIGENIELALVLDPQLGRVKADQGQVEQVIVNLAINARDAMPQGGKLTIETANIEMDDTYARQHPPMSPGSFIMLAITDTGVGMDAETQSHIFEPFFTTKERGKGTGLGLATVYGIVRQSGGYIWVYSEPKHGTRFRIYLPRVEEPFRAVARDTSPDRSWRGSETVVVVEDDESLRTLIRSLLGEHGYNVLEAANGTQAMEVVQQFHGKIDLLLTDMVMPGKSGRQVADEVTLLYPETKVLYMSGYMEFAAGHREILQQGRLLLQKPFTQQSLARKVREALEVGEGLLASDNSEVRNRD